MMVAVTRGSLFFVTDMSLTINTLLTCTYDPLQRQSVTPVLCMQVSSMAALYGCGTLESALAYEQSRSKLFCNAGLSDGQHARG